LGGASGLGVGPSSGFDAGGKGCGLLVVINVGTGVGELDGLGVTTGA